MPDSDYESSLIPDASWPGPRLHRRRLLGLLACSPFLGRLPVPEGRPLMHTYWFSLIIAGKTEFTDEEADALFEAGFDDGTLVSGCGGAFLDLAREAESLG